MLFYARCSGKNCMAALLKLTGLLSPQRTLFSTTNPCVLIGFPPQMFATSSPMEKAPIYVVAFIHQEREAAMPRDIKVGLNGFHQTHKAFQVLFAVRVSLQESMCSIAGKPLATSGPDCGGRDNMLNSSQKSGHVQLTWSTG